MEKKGFLVPVSESSDNFRKNVLAPLQKSYLYDKSKESFRYESAFLIKNPRLRKKYDAFRAKKRTEGYTKEELKEEYGFVLFDDKNKANKLGETGLVTGNSTCTTLGDPSKGVYISKYADCLDENLWSHGKSGFIVIFTLTKGRVKKVPENYTQKFTAPSVGFDCHVSVKLSTVSANTSSFLAFERTQYYMYERLHDGRNETAQTPSQVCPLAIVSFSYMDNKILPNESPKKSKEKGKRIKKGKETKKVFHYFPWSGQLQIGSQLYCVALKSKAGALIPAQLPPILKVDQAISMLVLRQLVPKTIFETCFSGEVFVDGMYCSLYELLPIESKDTSLNLLTQELKEKDLALAIKLKDGGFLMMLHSSQFLTFDDAGSSTNGVIQGIFVYPESRTIQRDTKIEQSGPTISNDILQVLPALNYAESEMEKCFDKDTESGELCGLLEQHIQSYATLINPGLTSSYRESSIFPDQYDVPDAFKDLYSAPKWTSRAWKTLGSYLSNLNTFQLPVSKATELLAAGQQELPEDLDDVYICLSSPEETAGTSNSVPLEDHSDHQDSPAYAETFMDGHIADSPIKPQSELIKIVESRVSLDDTGKSVSPQAETLMDSQITDSAIKPHDEAMKSVESRVSLFDTVESVSPHAEALMDSQIADSAITRQDEGMENVKSIDFLGDTGKSAFANAETLLERKSTGIKPQDEAVESRLSKSGTGKSVSANAETLESVKSQDDVLENVESRVSLDDTEKSVSANAETLKDSQFTASEITPQDEIAENVESRVSLNDTAKSVHANAETLLDSLRTDSTIKPQDVAAESRVSISNTEKSVSANAETLTDSLRADSTIKPQDVTVESRVSISDTEKSVSANAETLLDSLKADSTIKPQDVTEESRVSISNTEKLVSVNAETLTDSQRADSTIKPQDEVVENVESRVSLDETGRSVSANAEPLDSQHTNSAITTQEEQIENVESRVSHNDTVKYVPANAETLMDSEIANSAINSQDKVMENVLLRVSFSDTVNTVFAHDEVLMDCQNTDPAITPQEEMVENVESRVPLNNTGKSAFAVMDSQRANSDITPQDDMMENVESKVSTSDTGDSISAHAETLMDSQIADSAIEPEYEVMENLSDSGKSVPGVVPTSEPSTELIVVVSAERVINENPSTSPIKHEVQSSILNLDKLQLPSLDTINHKLDTSKSSLASPENNHTSNIDFRKLPTGRGRRGKSKTLRQISVQTSSIPSEKLPLPTSMSSTDKCDTGDQPPKHSHLAFTFDLRKLRRRRGRGREIGTRRSPRSAVQTSSIGSDRLQQDTDLALNDNCDTDGRPHLKLRLKLPQNIDWRKLPRCGRSKRRSKHRHELRSAADEVEDKVPGIMDSVHLTELEDWPLRKKTERCDLKPVISQCGRILVPHGTVDIAEQIKFLRSKQMVTIYEKHCDEMLMDPSVGTLRQKEIGKEPFHFLEMKPQNADPIKSIDKDNHFKGIDVSEVNLEQKTMKSQDAKEHSLENNMSQGNCSVALAGTQIAVEQKDSGIPLPAEDVKSRDCFLSKLKTVLSEGNKRKQSQLVSADATLSCSSHGNEPSLKKSKAISDLEMLRNPDSVTSILDSTERTEKMTLDPVFAHALGLARKEVQDELQNSKFLVQPTTDSITDQVAAQAHVATQAFSEKLVQTIQRQPTPIIRRRMKTLKKRQNLSTQAVKEKCIPFQVSPLRGSGGLQHHQNMYYSEAQAQHLFVSEEEQWRRKYQPRPPEHLQDTVCTKTFRQARSFVEKNGSIQVTRIWKENYDFSLDSKFTTDPSDKTVVRALHGPWDFTVPDTFEEVRLIVHMWISLFYSRSTVRFFQIDPEVLRAQNVYMPPVPAQTELLKNCFAPVPTITPNASDIHKEPPPPYEVAVLDLRVRNQSFMHHRTGPHSQRKADVSSENMVDVNTSQVLQPPSGLHGSCASYLHHAKVQTFVKTNDDVRSCQGREATPSQKIWIDLNHTAMPLKSAICTEASSTQQKGNVWTQESSEVSGAHGESQKPDEPIQQNYERCDMEFSPPTLHIDEDYTSDCNATANDLEVSPPTRRRDDYTSDCIATANDNHLLFKQQSTGEETKARLDENVEEDKNDCHAEDDFKNRKESESGRIGYGDKEDDTQVDSSVHQNVVPDGTSHKMPSHVKSQSMVASQTIADLNIAISQSKDVLVGKGENIDHSFEAARQITHSDEFSFQLQDKLSSVKVSEMEGGQAEIPFIGRDNTMQEVLLSVAVHSHNKGVEMERKDSLLTTASQEVIPLLRIEDDEQDMVEHFLYSQDNDEAEMIDNSTELSSQQQPQYSQATVSEVPERQVEIPLIGMDTSAQDMLDFECEENSPHSNEFDTTQSESILIGCQQNDVKGDLCLTNSQNSQDQVEIPFIGIDSSRQGLFDSLILHSQGDDKELDRTRIPSPVKILKIEYKQDSLDQFLYSQDKIEEMDIEYERLPIEHGVRDSSLFQGYGKGKPELPFLCSLKEIPPLEENNSRLLDPQAIQHVAKEVFQTVKDTLPSNQQIGYIESEYDDRCPTPTIDEKPYDYMPSCNADEEVCEIVKDKDHCVPTLIEDQLPLEQGHHISEDISPNLKNEQKPLTDSHMRTLRVLEALSKQLSKSSHTDPSWYPVTSKETGLLQTNALAKVFARVEKSKTNTDLLQNVNDNSFTQRPVMAVKPSKNDSGAKSEEPMDMLETVPRGNRTTYLTSNMGAQTGSSIGVSEVLKKREITSNAKWASDDEEIIEKFNLDEPKLALIDALYQYTACDHSDIKGTPSVQVKLGQTSADIIEITEKNPSSFGKREADGKCFTTEDSTSSMKCTVFYSSRMGSKPSLMEQLSERCQQSDPTQSSMERECLIFSEKMNQLMKRKRSHAKDFDRSKTHRLEKVSPITVRFSHLQEQEDSLDHFDLQPRLDGQRIKVDIQEKEGLAETQVKENTLQFHKLSHEKGYQGSCATVSDMTSECTRSYQAMMNDVCSGKKRSSKTECPKKGSSYIKSELSNHVDLSGQTKREMYDSLQNNLNSIVRRSCKTKFRFYILVTSDDIFFKETKAQLEANGHIEVEPFQFFLGEGRSSLPLLIIIRNEDIAEHICEVPYLPRLKRSPGVFFSGIDEPDDIVNLTHQEVFSRGGFVVFDRSALQKLSLDNVKSLLQALEDLTKTGKWKWMLHYRDSRQLKEDARLSAEAKEKKYLIDCCQEAGMVEVLPYHECDLVSQEQPNYLSCLSNLQVQNISARFPVFITDAAVAGVFGKSGILAMNIDAFLITAQSEFYTLS